MRIHENKGNLDFHCSRVQLGLWWACMRGLSNKVDAV